MKKITMGDIPTIPKGLNKVDPFLTDSPKRSGKIKNERHRIKEFLKSILKINK